jgi:PLP dependent protein
MNAIAAQLETNLVAVSDRIAAACARVGRKPAEVTLVAVTKYARPSWVRGLVSLGVRDLGESRPQQLVERAEWFDVAVRWHLIGPLQRNKVRKLLPTVALIHSVDSLRLLSAIDRIAAEERLQPRVLLEVNVSGEEAKHGFAPEEVWDRWSDIAAATHVTVAGLMTMAPWDDDPERSRPVFRKLRQLRDELRERSNAADLRELSMGMSGDFEVAVEEGATLVRIGSRLFEGLAE